MNWTRLTLGILILVVLSAAFLWMAPVEADDIQPTPFEIGPDAIHIKLFRAATGQRIGDAPIVFPRGNPIIIAGQIVRGALALLGLIFFTLMIYGGSLYLTAGGNEEQVKKAVHVLARAAIGGLIVIFAGAITQFLTGQLARPVVPAAALPAEMDTSVFGGCQPGYRYVVDFDQADTPSYQVWNRLDFWNWDAKCRRI